MASSSTSTVPNKPITLSYPFPGRKALTPEEFQEALQKTKQLFSASARAYEEPPVVFLTEPMLHRKSNWMPSYNILKQYECLPSVTKDNFRTLIEQMVSPLGHEHVWMPTKFAVHVYWAHSDENIYSITFVPHLSEDTIMLELFEGTAKSFDVLRQVRFHLQQHNIIANDSPQVLIPYVHETLEYEATQLTGMFAAAIRPNALGMEYSMFSMFLLYIKHSVNHMKFLEAQPDAISVLFDIIQGAIRDSEYRIKSYHMKDGLHGVFSDNHSRCATTVLKYFVQSDNSDVIAHVKSMLTPEHIILLEQVALIESRIIPSIAMHAKDILFIVRP